jgi:hypothetical protein
MSSFFGVLPLTLGKVYDVIGTGRIPFSPDRKDYGVMYTIIDDSGEVRSYSIEILRKLNQQEERELKLNELGI